MSTYVYRIRGMDCAEEIAVLKRELGPLVGGENRIAFDLLNAKITIESSDENIRDDTIIAAVARTGMQAETWRDPKMTAERGPTGWAHWGRLVMTATSGSCVAAAFVIDVVARGFEMAGGFAEGVPIPWFARFLYLAAAVTGGWYVLPKAWAALRRLRPDMNLLMAVAVTGALLIGEWFEAGVVAFLFALSLLIESWSVGRARRAISALMELTPPKARVLREADGREAMVPVDGVPVGSAILVKPGERFPLDGTVVRGETRVNQAPITGESALVEKAPGSEVFAGTINGDGAVEFTSTKPAYDTTLARIIRMVSEAQSRRAPSEQWVEKFARVYTPTVMALAVGVALAPPLVLGDWGEWFYRALVLLVIACPCALVISTPVSIVAALTAAARHGVLIKGGVYVEVPARLQAIALDKTGTLTEGQPEVREVVPVNGRTMEDLLTIAAAIETRSEHPLAHTVIRYAESHNVPIIPAEDFQAIKGLGATARISGRPVWLGSHRLLEQRLPETPEMHARAENLAASGSTVIAVGEDHQLIGFIAVGDRVRSNARTLVAALKRSGIHHIIMLTGDNQATAKAVADETGVDEVFAELLPEDKVKAVDGLIERFGNVAMVGDGVNDAPALARASLGIAMGVAGTDAALETADIALMSDDLSRLPWLLHHSHRTLAIIRQNIVASLGVKALFVILTFTGLATLWAAIAADMGISLLVVFNALRLLRTEDTSFPTTAYPL
jgi:Cd2+/Zn2+-exporting ATPase